MYEGPPIRRFASPFDIQSSIVQRAPRYKVGSNGIEHQAGRTCGSNGVHVKESRFSVNEAYIWIKCTNRLDPMRGGCRILASIKKVRWSRGVPQRSISARRWRSNKS
ncbi:hypothetical protein QJS10_CPB20g01733 [Acorus calamus]|uniref:Uncharacterized protein n=1 Tax=Acorus calamus TaxID=4465 RepID=A0AAV9CB53_ACOCL|nr:hypothetical protein QJS10_CPB20g01733 [Acorus calamus]